MNLTRSTLMPACIVVLLSGMTLVGCAHKPNLSPYAQTDEIRRDTHLARELHQQATLSMAEDEEEAERLLRSALAADLYFGPAHNNLGIILLGRGDLYGAASEFEWARKLMPGHPDPRVNLAMTLEKAGKVDDAISAYDSALAVYDGYLPAIQGKARLQIVSGRSDNSTRELLEEIALRGDEQWRAWARLWMVKL
ncbi:MAG: tetratricopeptide repeat protein [Phycisphaerales bacterium]